MKQFISLLLLFFFGVTSFAQQDYSKIDKNLKAYSIETINTLKLKESLSEFDFNQLTLELNGTTYEMEIYSSHFFREGYVGKTSSGETITNLPKAFRGSIVGNPISKVRLTVNDDFLMGHINDGTETFAFQPAWYYDRTLPRNKFVVYNVKDIIDKEEHNCPGGLHDHEEEIIDDMDNDRKALEQDIDPQGLVGLCFEVELGLATDWLMHVKFGSVGGVVNHITGVLNDVQTNYDNEFADEIDFVMGANFIVSTSGGDPWTSSTNAGALLPDFRGWGQSGFGVPIDVATLWTNRNFDGSTVGLAYVGTVCNFSRFNTCQDFSSSAWALRVVQAHELGHNFSSGHDGGGGFIMSGSVNNSNTWSAQSVNSINAHITSRNCLATCAPVGPPTANFSATVTNPCVPGTVDFLDESTNNPTSWSWTFPGGIPATSTLQNPTVTYNAAGTYNATLVATNALGTDTSTLPVGFDILDVPMPSFTYNVVWPTTTIFTNNSIGGTSYLWDFGDGNTSTLFEPTHIYAAGGTFAVTLIVTNSCGTAPTVQTFTIDVDPVASFTSDIVSGCEPMVVNFEDTSTNFPSNWLWSFEGGSPVTSTDENPIVSYLIPGVYDVTLEISNQYSGDVIMITDYITVDPLPIPDFSYTVNGASVNFLDESSFADSWAWDFGDGNNSVLQNPLHTYTASGTYTVVLEITNSCGTETFSQDVMITLMPEASFTTVQTPLGCADYTIDFMDTSAGDPDSWLWTFPGGSPATSTDQNPTVVYSAMGTFDVTLEVTNSQGSDTITETDLVVIDDIPVLSFTFVSDLLIYNFTSNISNATSFEWEFGDGNTSVEANPSHTYAAEGMYNVTLTATNNCGQAVFSNTVNAVNLPSADFSVAEDTGCLPFTVSFNDLSSSNVTGWSWSFPGGNPSSSTAQNPTVTYDNAGSYDVSLMVTAPGGSDMITIMDQITVQQAPTASYDFVLNGNTIDLINNTPETTASWTVSDGAMYALNTTSHTFAENGNYTVDLVVTNDCGSDEAQINVSITAYPTAGFTSNSNTGCLPFTVVFDETSTEASGYQWTFEGGTPASSTDANPTVVYSSAGTYDVTLLVTNQYGQDETISTDLITVNAGPTADFTSTTSGSNLMLTNTSVLGNTYMWDFGDGGSSMEENPNHQYQATGTYTVTLVVTNDCGESTISYDVVMNFTTPGIAASFSSELGCVPMVVQITDESSNNPTSWNWTFPGGDPATSTDQNPTVTYNTPGVYSIDAVISNADGSSNFTFTDAIEVQDVPMAGFTSDALMGDVTFTNTSTNADSYSWDFGDGETSVDENPVHSYSSTGNYDVVLTAYNMCGETTTTITVSVIISSNDDIEIANDFFIAPNPNNGSFVIEFSQPLSHSASIKIVDVLGRTTYEKQQIALGAKKVVVDNLSSKGTHFVQITVGEKQIVKKLIVI